MAKKPTPKPKHEPEVAATKPPSTSSRILQARARFAVKRGHPEHRPTEEDRELVSDLAVIGLQHMRIAAHLGISEPTLRKHFAQELDTAHDEAIAGAIKHGLVRQAQMGNVTAAIFLAKTRLGWTEKSHIEVTGKDGAALEREQKEALADRVLGLIEQANAKAAAAGAKTDTPPPTVKH